MMKSIINIRSRIQVEFNDLLNLPFVELNFDLPEYYQSNINQSYDLLSQSILSAGEIACGKSKSISPEDDPDGNAIGHLFLFNANKANKLLAKHHRKAKLHNFKLDVNKMDTSNFIKRLKWKRRRKFTPKSMLDYNKRDIYIDKLHDKWNNDLYNDLCSKCPHIVQNTFSFTMDHLQNALKKLPHNKTPGGDDIDGELLYRATDRCKEMMLQIINIFLHTGLLPDALKFSDIVPIYKKLTGIDITHYRPIALSSHFCKLVEIMLQNVVGYIFQTSTNQYGYKKNTFISDALYDIQQIMNQLIKKKKKYLVKVDVSGAFDNLSRPKIKDMIDNSTANLIFKRLLWSIASEQYLRLRFGQFISIKIGSNRGVIQGGITSPPIFTKVVDIAFVDWNSDLG